MFSTIEKALEHDLNLQLSNKLRELIESFYGQHINENRPLHPSAVVTDIIQGLIERRHEVLNIFRNT